MAELLGDNTIGPETLLTLRKFIETYGGQYYVYQDHELYSGPGSTLGHINYLRVGGRHPETGEPDTYQIAPEMIAPKPGTSKRIVLVGKVDLEKGLIVPIEEEV